MKKTNHKTGTNTTCTRIINDAGTVALRIYKTGVSITNATVGSSRINRSEANAIESPTETAPTREEISSLFRALAFNLIDNKDGYHINRGTPVRAEEYDKEKEEAKAIYSFLDDEAALQINEKSGEPLIMTAPGGRVFYDFFSSGEWFIVGQNVGQKRYVEEAKAHKYFSKIMLYPAIKYKFVSLAEYERISMFYIEKALNNFFA
jgi:hypothetical protein